MSATMVTLISFLGCMGMVALLTWLIVRRGDRASVEGYFLSSRGLTFPFIAGSLLLSDLSTIELVGLNGDAFAYGLSAMVWEVVAVIALVVMALWFLPRYLQRGIYTVPQLLSALRAH